MAALSASPPPMSNSPGSEQPSMQSLSSVDAPRIQNVPRKPLDIHSIPTTTGTRLRDAPVSPVRVNHQQDNFAQPSNANIEFTQPHVPQYALVDRTREPSSGSPTTPRSPVMPRGGTMRRVDEGSDVPPHPPAKDKAGTQIQHSASTVSSATDSSVPEVNFSQGPNLGLDRYEPSAMDPRERVRNQDAYRHSRESDDTTSTN